MAILAWFSICCFNRRLQMIGCALLLLLVLFFFKYLCWVGPWTKERSSSHPWCEIKFQSLRKCHSTRVLRRKGRKKKSKCQSINPVAEPQKKCLISAFVSWQVLLSFSSFQKKLKMTSLTTTGGNKGKLWRLLLSICTSPIEVLKKLNMF